MRNVHARDAAVLDASAVLALLNQEPGAERVAAALGADAAISAVNYAEVVGKLADAGMPDDAIRQALDALELNVVALDRALAHRTGLLRTATHGAGLSLGDRACLALAAHDQATVLTADRRWAGLALGLRVVLIR